MQVTFKNGQFYLDHVPTDLKTAVRFRQHGDAVVRKIFNRCLQKFYRWPHLPPLSFLDPHQRKGIEWILTRSRSYLAHAPGAGKTCQAILAALLTKMPGQTIIIAPPTLTINWQREILKWSAKIKIYPTTMILPISALQSNMNWTADFIIISDSMLHKDWVYKNLSRLQKKFIAVDEASRFKEPNTLRSVAFYGGKSKEKVYQGLFQGVPHTVFLDGSPMPNRPMELWAPTFALDPGAIDFMEYHTFGYHYCGALINDLGQWEFRGSAREEELHQKITSRFMQVVTEDKLSHPERLRSILFMSEDPRSRVNIKWEQKQIQRLKFSDVSESMSVGDLAYNRKETGLKKIRWVASYVESRLSDKKEESILLFAWHREVCEKLASTLKKWKPSIIYGGVKSDRREKAIKDFNSGKSRLLIGNIQALGRGHNIQKADRVVFAEYSWTDELNRQCEKRSSRRGRAKENPVRCEYVVIPDSLDEVVLNSIFNKMRRVKRVIG
jgi:SWI/SNF-related matrix-associated actin-dependent regulator of chromatin subfamily A-like protein 1